MWVIVIKVERNGVHKFSIRSEVSFFAFWKFLNFLYQQFDSCFGVELTSYELFLTYAKTQMVELFLTYAKTPMVRRTENDFQFLVFMSSRDGTFFVHYQTITYL